MVEDETVAVISEVEPTSIDYAYSDVTELQWGDPSNSLYFTCIVHYKDAALGNQRFAANPLDSAGHGREIFQRAVDDEAFGPIASYQEPILTDEGRRASMPPLDKWRLEAMIDLHGQQHGVDLRGKIDAAVEALPEPNRTIAKSKRVNVNQYYRTDPLFDFIGSDETIGMSPEAIDELWSRAAAL